MSAAEDVTSFLKSDPAACVCGCGVVGRPIKRNGHARGCDRKRCSSCRNAGNAKKGRRKQSAAFTAVGIPRSVFHPGHEEQIGGAVRLEVKAGGRMANPVWTRYQECEAQSEAQRPIGDHRPFAAVFMPDGTSDGLLVVKLSNLHELAAAIVEMWGAS